MRCASCGSDSEAGKRFCGDCGAELGARCAACGAALEPGKRFCGDCGAAALESGPAGGGVSAEVAVTARAVTERRFCTVLFCDLVGFTALSEARDPEEVRELLSRYFEAARTVVGRYGGVVEKFIGDAVMAVWGTPTAAEGDAERAVRAALDLVDAVAELGRETGAPALAARAGVVTGEVAVTLGAVGQGMVAGDAVNTAARVQAAAAPGRVLLDANTERLVRAAVACTTAGEQVLKGKAEPVALWQAGRVVSQVGGAQRIDGLEAPLVGRDAELRLVRELFHACADRGSVRLVSVVGAAGVGKSRLGWEFEKYADGLAQQVWWHRGRCLSYGDGIAFFALAEMVRARLGVAEEDPASTVAARLAAGLDTFVPDPATRGYLRPRLARLLGVPTEHGDQLGREELFAGWRTFFEQLAAVQPVIMLIEDLQHADPGLLDFLEHLLDWAHHVPIFLLTLARPELEERRPGWGTGRRSATSLTLEPLDTAAMNEMLDGLVAGLPRAARSSIAEQAQGIPLYAVETMRMLIDRDVVRPVEGVYRLVGEIGELSVPESLQSLLTARLDALPGELRSVVADCAVLGATFPLDALVAVGGLEPGAAATVVAELVRREVLAVRADPLSPERGQYGFVQPMLRQVAHDMLSRRERKTRHLAVAEHLSRAFPDGGEEVSEVIAAHLLDALEAVPGDPDAPELRRRAAERLTRAAERARRTGALATAATEFGRAAELLLAEPDGPRLAAVRLLEQAGTAAGVAGQFGLAEPILDRAAELYRGLDLPRDAGRAMTTRSRALRRLDRFDEAREQLRVALDLLGSEPDAQSVRALTELADLEAFSGRAAECGSILDAAFETAQALGLGASDYPELFISRGLSLALVDRNMEASAALREAYRIAAEIGADLPAGRALTNLSDLLLSLGRPAEAADGAAQAAVLLRRAGSSDFCTAVGNQAEALLMTGDWTGARALLLEVAHDPVAQADPIPRAILGILDALQGDVAGAKAGLEVFERRSAARDVQDRTTALVCSAHIAWVTGELADALAKAWAAIHQASALGYSRGLIARLWPLAAACALELGDLAAAQELLDLVDRQHPGHLHPVVRADAQRVRARLASARGEDGAAGAFAQATAALREVGAPWYLALGLADHADFAAATGEADLAAALAGEAAAIAAGLGAEPLLARVREAHPGAFAGAAAGA